MLLTWVTPAALTLTLLKFGAVVIQVALTEVGDTESLGVSCSITFS